MRLKFSRTKISWADYCRDLYPYPLLNHETTWLINEPNTAAHIKTKYKKKLLWIKTIQPDTFASELRYKVVL
jgi:hypothetical protein